MSMPAPLRPSEGVVAKQMAGSAVLIHLASSRIFELNATGARVWSMLEEGIDRAEICARLEVEFGVAPDEVRSTVDDLLGELERQGLVSV